MDRRLIRYYDRELRHLQTVAKEFAQEFPKIAGRLAIEEFPCVDPYVERLMEGFAFLTARIQLKIDSEFPRFTQNLLETVYPHYLAPTPSMCVVQLMPDRGEAGLADGYAVPRGTVLRSVTAKDMTSCEYRTSHDLKLWSVELLEARYFTRDTGTLELNRIWGASEADQARQRPTGPAPRAAIRLRLRTTAGVPFNKVGMPNLVLYLRGSDATPWRLHEALLAHSKGVLVRPVPTGMRAGSWQESLKAESIRRVGFAAGESMLPYDGRSFQGFRLLHEYFAFPQRFSFVEITDLAPILKRCDGNMLDVIIPLSQENPELEGAVSAENFGLHCTPAVNLFPKRCDRIFVSDKSSEFLVTPDRTKPLDYEVYRVIDVTGYGSRSGDERNFRPFYAATDTDGGDGSGAYYATHRVPRAISEREKRQGGRSTYEGGEVYLSLVDAQAAPFSTELKQLSVQALCTNRDLPLQMPIGKNKTDFTLDIGAPVETVRAVAGPTPPRASHVEGDVSWRLISHLTLNYLSLSDEDRDGDGRITGDEGRGAAALRALLKLYGDVGDPVIRKQIEGLRTVSTKGIARRVPTPGVVAFARGLEVAVTLQETQFEGTGVFVMGAVLEQFFARYVSMNSFTETVVRTEERGEIMRWPAKIGQRPVL